jgi:hypothetical protein
VGRLLRNWGLLAMALLVIGWLERFSWPVLIVLSLLSASYVLFGLPLWCGAITRENKLCRRNSTGLLMGCSLRQHKWQRVKMLLIPRMWRKLNKGLWISPKESLATVTALASIASCAAAVVGLLITSA